MACERGLVQVRTTSHPAFLTAELVTVLGSPGIRTCLSYRTQVEPLIKQGSNTSASEGRARLEQNEVVGLFPAGWGGQGKPPGGGGTQVGECSTVDASPDVGVLEGALD